MDDTKPKTFVFILMPFTDEFTDVYEVGIKPACKDAGAYCERVDEQIFVESILDRIYNQISKADIIVADMTGRNPNVFYEVGYAHALNKQVILLTQKSEDIPFDLKHYPHIVYKGKIASLKSQLEPRVQWCIQNPKSSLSQVDTQLEFFINGVHLSNEPEIVINGSSNRFQLIIDAYNPTGFVIEPSSYRLSILAPKHLKVVDQTSSISAVIDNPKGGQTWNLHPFNPLFPSATDRLSINRIFIDANSGRSQSVILRYYTKVGPRDYPFKLTFPSASLPLDDQQA